MAERSTIFEGVQIGIESTPGTGVAADKQLLATTFEFGASPEINVFRPTGHKFSTIASLDREFVEGSIGGQMSYGDIVYLLSSLINAPTPALETDGYAWVFESDTTGPDAPVTFTLEQGSSVRAHKFAYGMVTGLTLTFSNDGTELDGSLIGQSLQDDVAMTAAPTPIPLQPIMRPQVRIYLADTAAGLDAADPLQRIMNASWSLTDRFNPLWLIDGSTGFGVHTENVPSSEVSLLVAADGEGMGLLDTMREGATKFMRIEAQGPSLGTDDYSMVIDTAFKVSDVSPFQDEQGIYAVEWMGEFTHDTTWDKAFQITVVNDLDEL